ncbi:ATPase, T2SS/T4P/T4SS family [Phycisphaera mikurensis]|uniref:Putative type IV pilus assembly protein PilB n=1 Tax=Phycisphaera mikurensis (strain NBRC 102666 / KCTC 22515 / FYK2301M01) TaxID=1142394 RepID=I0IED5_PHYMF|nr:ATPase, T2SS/T4P/T4SS family [Phycisphaera mikurensis]MBB6441423.1 type II secretory ATPase GspE/PulE/Tfp pilus assembly ATPase PilB-like protein [Phycisphaera mikurensis]BAM03623.1 putative type IV pilus assembly protein PilB [Phycisphaera mikurensis NBRC 102666]
MTPEPAFLVSIAKPLLLFAVLLGWGRLVSFFDKDAAHFHLKRTLFNGLHLLGGVAGFGVMLLVPLFWLGLPLGVLLLAGSIAGYVYYRNGQVDDKQKWTLDLEDLRRQMAEKRQGKAQKATSVKLRRNGQEVEVPRGDDPRVEAHEQLERMLKFSVERDAETMDLVVEDQKVQLSAKIDGVRYPIESPAPDVALAAIDFMKQAAGLDIDDRRRRQSGRVQAEVLDEEGGSRSAELEILTAGSTRGVQMQVTLNPDASTEMPLDRLGLLPKQLEYLESVLGENKGAVVLAADKHQGAPTTMFAMLSRVDPYTNSAVLIASDDQIDLEGIDRHVFDRGKPASEFNSELAGILRTDPNIVMLDRIADAKTVALIAGLSNEIRFMLPLPQPDTTTAVKAYLKASGDPKEAAKGLSTVIGQRLVRRLCTTCRVPYSPNPAALKKLGIPQDKVGTLYKSSGKVLVKEQQQACPDCHGIAYRGRVGVFEVMPVDDRARKHMAAGEMDALRSHLRKQGMVYLQEAGLAKVVEGVTDIKEVQRVLAE